MRRINENDYSEIYSYLQTLGKEYINKIPQREYKLIIRRRNEMYSPIYKISDLANLSNSAKCIILYYYLKYWGNDNERQVIKDCLIRNGHTV